MLSVIVPRLHLHRTRPSNPAGPKSLHATPSYSCLPTLLHIPKQTSAAIIMDIDETTTPPPPSLLPDLPAEAPTNTAALLLPHQALFAPPILQILRDHYETYGRVAHWAPVKGFGRVIIVWEEVEGFERAKREGDYLKLDVDLPPAQPEGIQGNSKEEKRKKDEEYFSQRSSPLRPKKGYVVEFCIEHTVVRMIQIEQMLIIQSHTTSLFPPVHSHQSRPRLISPRPTRIRQKLPDLPTRIPSRRLGTNNRRRSQFHNTCRRSSAGPRKSCSEWDQTGSTGQQRSHSRRRRSQGGSGGYDCAGYGGKQVGCRCGGKARKWRDGCLGNA